MNEDRVKEWILKAESDLKIGKHEIETDDPSTDGICFHMQQCVEKYLKAYLTYQGKEFRKTHDLAELIEACREVDPDFDSLYELDVDRLTRYSIEIRYPGEFLFPSIDEARRAIVLAEKVREYIRRKLKKEGFEI